MEWEWNAVFNRNPALSLKWDKILPRLLLMIMGFQFLPKSVTLDDTEGLLCSCFENTFENTCIFGVHHEFLNEDTHIITGKHAGILTVGL